MPAAPFANPFRPGAGHMPPYLAGRKQETSEFLRLLKQDVILENMVLTGLRGVGKTVLLDTFKPLAIKAGWLWVGTDLSESVSLSEERLAVRLMADLAVVTSSIVVAKQDVSDFGFRPRTRQVELTLDYEMMAAVYEQTKGLSSDKLKALLEFVWSCLEQQKIRGVVFAYDEAQNLGDNSAQGEYPLSLLLDVSQSIQKKSVPFLLVLAGLPTLFPKLVEARTFTERMFRVVFLDRLNTQDSQEAITKPIEDARCPVKLTAATIQSIVDASAGYPYFIQFLCREMVDVLLQKRQARRGPSPSIHEMLRKLDADFFAGRWARATDRQRELLTVVAHLKNSDREFTVQEVARESKRRLKSPFSPSHINQMLVKLCEVGLVYKNRHGKYSFAVPLLGRFILRQATGAS
jgi:type II secretory pathway predicted ATPase ExeA